MQSVASHFLLLYHTVSVLLLSVTHLQGQALEGEDMQICGVQRWSACEKVYIVCRCYVCKTFV